MLGKRVVIDVKMFVLERKKIGQFRWFLNWLRIGSWEFGSRERHKPLARDFGYTSKERGWIRQKVAVGRSCWNEAVAEPERRDRSICRKEGRGQHYMQNYQEEGLEGSKEGKIPSAWEEA